MIKDGLREALTFYKGNPPADLLHDIPMSDHIPKIFHQTHTLKRLPSELQANVDRLKELNPGWEHRFYDDETRDAFILEHFGPRIFAYYNRIDPAYGAPRADLFRYLVTYKLGGVYLDMKSTITKPLDEILRPDDRYIVSYWNNAPGEFYEGWGFHDELRPYAPKPYRGEIQQWHIISAAGHPFLRATLEQVLHNIHRYNPLLHGTGRFGALRVTGPIAFSRAVYPLLDHHPHRLVEGEKDCGIEYSIYAKSGGQTAHVGMHSKHYSLLETPLAQTGAVELALSQAMIKLKKRLTA